MLSFATCRSQPSSSSGLQFCWAPRSRFFISALTEPRPHNCRWRYCMGFAPSSASAASLSHCAVRHGGWARAWPPFGLFATALLAVAALAGAGMLAARVLKKRISGDDDRHPGDARRERLGHLAVYVFAG